MRPLGFGPWVLSFCELTFLDCENVLWLGVFLVYLKYGVVSFFVIYYYLSCSLFKFCLFIKILHFRFSLGSRFLFFGTQYFVSRLSFYVPLCSTSVLPCVKLAPRSLFSCVFLFYFGNYCSMAIVWCLRLSFISVVSSCASHLLSPLLYTLSLTRSVHGCVIPLWSCLCKPQLCSSHLWFL